MATSFPGLAILRSEKDGPSAGLRYCVTFTEATSKAGFLFSASCPSAPAEQAVKRAIRTMATTATKVYRLFVRSGKAASPTPPLAAGVHRLPPCCNRRLDLLGFQGCYRLLPC